MIVHLIASAPDMTGVLLWGEREGEWRVGHQRAVAYTGEDYWIDGSIRDTEELIKDEMPLSIFTEVTHWTALPPKMSVLS